MVPRLPLILVGLAGASLLLVHTVLGAVVAGVLWAILSWPLHRWLTRHMRPSAAAGITLFSTGVAMAALLYLLARVLLDDLREVAASGELFLTAPAALQPAQAKLMALMGDMAARLETAAWTVVLQIPIAVFVAFCCLREGHRIVRAGARLLPLPLAQTLPLLAVAGQKTRSVARGQLLMAAIKGTVGGIGLWIAGVPGPVVWGVVMAIFTLLPILAAWMVWVPAALWLASRGDTTAAAFLAVYGVLVVGLIDNVLRPILVGRHARMHPMVALVGMAGGALTLGLAGLVAGPVLLDTTIALILAWRTAEGHDVPVTTPSAPHDAAATPSHAISHSPGPMHTIPPGPMHAIPAALGAAHAAPGTSGLARPAPAPADG